jgi:hypothetical protein
MNELIHAAEAAARSIEAAAAEHGTTYAAAQAAYGVEVEVLVGEDWGFLGDLEDGAEVKAVRLFDCDGERGRACRTVEQVEGERVKWVRMLESVVESATSADDTTRETVMPTYELRYKINGLWYSRMVQAVDQSDAIDRLGHEVVWDEGTIKATLLTEEPTSD